jgi:hypothetical protein
MLHPVSYILLALLSKFRSELLGSSRRPLSLASSSSRLNGIPLYIILTHTRSFNLAGSFLPIVLLNNNVNNGRGTVTDTYRQYVYIYLPGILGAVLALLSVQLPLIGRKWSLVFSAAMQGLSMAMYTQVKTTAGYVGLNALEYVMQTVSGGIAQIDDVYETKLVGFETTLTG